MRRVCTICARGGSKGVPGKNLRPVLGRPLIAYSVEQAVGSGLFEAVAVSSDDERILTAGLEAGATHVVRRPDALASDTAGKAAAIAHCVSEVEAQTGSPFEVVVDLDVTSPLRSASDIVGAVQLLEASGVTNVITGAPARRSPYFNLVERDKSGNVRLSKPPAETVLRRQDAPECFDMNASIYVWRRDDFLRQPKVFYEDTRLFAMPEDRSIDIDSELDFQIVSYLMGARNGRH